MGSTIPRLTVEVKDKVQQIDHDGKKLVDTGAKRTTKSKAKQNTSSNKRIKLGSTTPPTAAAWEPEQHPQPKVEQTTGPMPTTAQVPITTAWEPEPHPHPNKVQTAGQTITTPAPATITTNHQTIPTIALALVTTAWEPEQHPHYPTSKQPEFTPAITQGSTTTDTSNTSPINKKLVNNLFSIGTIRLQPPKLNQTPVSKRKRRRKTTKCKVLADIKSQPTLLSILQKN